MALGVPAGHFEELVQIRNEAAGSSPPVPQEGKFPRKFIWLCEHLAHHLIPLMPPAGSDGDFAGAVGNVIIEHCAVAAGLSAERRTVPDGTCGSRRWRAPSATPR
jgi:hypothetical protein